MDSTKPYTPSTAEALSPESRRLPGREFASAAPMMLDGLSRRQFLKLMGASTALAGAAGCRWPEAYIAPFNAKPADRIPGVPVHYATTMELGGVAGGLLATSFDGRPIKIEGNPLHPTNRGATTTFQQASVLDLYDPDRSQQVLQQTAGADGKRTAQPSSWDAFVAQTQTQFAGFRSQGGQGLYVLSEATSSPTVHRLRAQLAQACPGAVWLEYEPLSLDSEREAARLVFGQPFRLHYDLSKADVIVSLDSDLLGSHPNAIRYARDFTDRRRPPTDAAALAEFKMNRLYAFESVYSLTGAMADVRVPVSSTAILHVALQLANHLFELVPASQPATVTQPATASQPTTASQPATTAPKEVRVPLLGDEVDAAVRQLVDDPAFKAVLPAVPPAVLNAAADLVANRRRCLVIAGPRQPVEVHVLALVMNSVLHSFENRALQLSLDPNPDRPSYTAAITRLAKDLHAGQVDTLVVMGANPAYTAPADLDLPTGLTKAKTLIHLGLHQDETGRLATWHVPAAHYLESWADSRAWDGTISLTQPLIAPLYNGKTPAELLAVVLGEPAKAHDLVRQTARGLAGVNDFETWWKSVLHDGLIPNTALQGVSALSNFSTVPDKVKAIKLPAALPADGNQFELVLTPSANVYDGRFANNGWLQETADTMTKLTWTNALLVSPQTAKRLKVQPNDVVRVTAGATSVELAVLVIPGQADGSVTAALGYGREKLGRVARFSEGVNLYPLRTTATMDILPAVQVQKIGKVRTLPVTQEYFPVQTLGGRETDKRADILIQEADVATFKKKPDFAKSKWDKKLDKGHIFPLWTPHEYKGYKWGMTIDLSACIGCAACEVACMAENNISVVGPDEVRRGREMHWIRIDRYFKNQLEHPEAPGVGFQPLTCVQCENAPCEQVCPVAATVHDHEGLNVMVYNRCIGTRYCSNNCPFKVRRFNWFWNQKNLGGDPLTPIQKMVFNPDVTMRSRGVMEKCTYCTQRITQARITAKNKAVAELEAKRVAGLAPADAALPEKVVIPDGTITPACAQACPTQAITFGDLNDPTSKVAQLNASARQYGLLTELNLRARTNYLARLRNTGAPAPETSSAPAPAEH